MSGIFYQILDPKRKAIFDRLSSLKNKAYLAGGTALALQLNHRLSLDFDLFLAKPLSRYFFREIRSLFGSNFETVRKSTNQISILTTDKIKVDFVHYWYPLLTPTVKTTSIDLASIDDIAADKAATIGRRAQWRDYVDLFILMKQDHASLEKIMEFGKKKFGGEFNELLFLEQLIFFDDLKISKIEFIQEQHKETEIKNFLERGVKQYLKDHLKN